MPASPQISLVQAHFSPTIARREGGRCFFGWIREMETGLRNRSHLLLLLSPSFVPLSRCLPVANLPPRRPCLSVRPSSSGFGHRNKIKCGEEKTPLVFGDIAIVIGGEREGGRRKKYANLSRKDRKGPAPLLLLLLLLFFGPSKA